MADRPPDPAPAADEPAARLAALRNAGAQRHDPVRFHALEALARRAAGQPPAVRDLLLRRLDAEVSACAARLASAQASAAPAHPVVARAAANGSACGPLAQLNDYLRGGRPRNADADGHAEAQHPDELASVHRFREAYTRNRTHERIDEARARRPANAGPLNSHVLVLQALALMRELSPEYLRHFIGHVEALQWLEQARAKQPVASRGARAAGRARGRK